MPKNILNQGGENYESGNYVGHESTSWNLWLRRLTKIPGIELREHCSGCVMGLGFRV